MATDTSEAAEYTITRTGTITNLAVNMEDNVVMGDDNSFTMTVNGVNSALTCTIPDGMKFARDVTNVVNVSPGDKVQISYGAGADNRYNLTCFYQPT